MACVPAPACKAALAQATARWPARSKASDGICASPQHSGQNPSSDHELGNAVDLTHDPAHGCDAHQWAEVLRIKRDKRVKYIISRNQIVSSRPVAGYPAWAWRPYGGANPHTKHVHVSIHAASRGDCSPWFDKSVPPKPAPPPAPEREDDEMLIAGDGTSAWLIVGDRRIYIQSPVELNRLKMAGIKYVEAPALVARIKEAETP